MQSYATRWGTRKSPPIWRTQSGREWRRSAGWSSTFQTADRYANHRRSIEESVLILDTNVVSEALRPNPAPQVLAWLGAQVPSEMYLTAVSAAELRYGAAALPDGARRDALIAAVDAMLRVEFRGRVLPFDAAAATAYAEIATARRRAGRPISQFDCQIAAIAREVGAGVATRNAKDFDGCGVAVVDPWHAGL